MVKFALDLAVKRLAALRSKADKQTKELIEESMKPATRKRLEGERTETIRKIKDLKKDIEDNLPPGAPRPPGMAVGGAVLSRGLSGLIQNYSTGPLARISVPRGTPQGMFRGGAPGMRDVGFRGPQQISGTADSPLLQSAISGALANIPPAPAAQTNVAIQSPAERLATTTAPTRTALTPVGQTLKGTRPTDFLGFATTEGVAEGQAFEPGMLLYEGTDVLQSPTGPTGPTAEEIAAQQAAEEAAAQAAAEEAARIEAERAAGS